MIECREIKRRPGRHAAALVRANERFLNHVSPCPNTGCWFWSGAVTYNGYGLAFVGGKKVRAHRLSVAIATGEPVPEDTLVLHSCDQPLCVNPEHLRLGTYLENAGDKVSRARGNHGSRHPMAKYTETDVAEMRRLFSSGLSRRDVARRFSAPYSTVAQILRGHRWVGPGGWKGSMN